MTTLTKKEQAWITRVQKALDACPSKDKIGFYTTGDKDVTLFDLRMYDKVANLLGSLDFDTACDRVGASFGEFIEFPSPVESTAG